MPMKVAGLPHGSGEGDVAMLPKTMFTAMVSRAMAELLSMARGMSRASVLTMWRVPPRSSKAAGISPVKMYL